MTTRGLMYLVHAQRPDGGWICFRTCDRPEAERMALILDVSVTVDEH
ncbi:MAG TPA: hypothetical protein VI248_23975 [Kineosporiaceae bacterium]